VGAVQQRVAHGQSGLGGEVPGRLLDLFAGEAFVVEGDRQDGLAGDQLDGVDLLPQRVQGVAGEAVVLTPGGGVLEDHAVGPRGGSGGTSVILRLKKWSRWRGGGRRTSRRRTPCRAAREAISGSSPRKSCSPESTFRPARTADRTACRASGGRRPPSGARPMT